MVTRRAFYPGFGSYALYMISRLHGLLILAMYITQFERTILPPRGLKREQTSFTQ